MRTALLTVILILAGTPSTAQSIRADSAYTALDLDHCQRLDRDQEHASARWRCPGFAGVMLFVQNGDDRYDIDAGREDADEHWSDSFDYPGRTVEWRTTGGRPFAIIYRLDSANREAPGRSRLVVETIGRHSPGCRVAAIDARSRDANRQARRAADQILRGRPRCLKN